jgi:hypothetical protein
MPPDDRPFLDRVGPHRSHATNLFLAQARAGVTMPQAIILRVTADLQARIAAARRYGQHDQEQRDQLILDAIYSHVDEARDMAAWAVEWETTPREQREQVKAQRGEQYRHAYMASQPATEKQIGYLRKLGYAGAVNSKAHASELIDGLLSQRGGRG